MSNKFLDNYTKNTADEAPSKAPAQNASVPSAKPAGNVGYYEQKSGFHAPAPVPVVSAKKPRSAAGTVIGCVIGAVIVALIIAAVVLLSGKITVPDFDDYSIADVQLWCSQNGVNLQKTEEYNEQIEEKKIIRQSIEPGQKIKKGDFLSVIVSLGVDLSVEVTLPDFSAMTKGQIEDWASENFMSKVRITTENSETVAVGKVIRYEINDNTVVGNIVKRDTPIYVILSKGSASETDVTVPDFKTFSLAEIYAYAQTSNLIVTVKLINDDYIPANTVISQSVAADKRVSAGTEVVVKVSQGALIRVPDFSALTPAQAQSKAAGLGIDVSVTEVYSQFPAGAFVSQSAAADSVYRSGTEIELQYSMGNSIIINSFIGRYEYEVSDWVEEQNKNGANLSLIFTYTESQTEPGTVISQNYQNTRIPLGTVLTVFISKGMPVFVPSFVTTPGRPYAEIFTREKAVELCESLGLTPIFTEGSTTDRLPGEIYSQSIAAGTEVTQGTAIVLQYMPVRQTVTVPDLIRETRYVASRYERQFEIEYVLLDEFVEGYEDRVYRQSLKAGTVVAIGSKLTVYIAPVSDD